MPLLTKINIIILLAFLILPSLVLGAANTELHRAAQNGDLKKTKALIKDGIDVNTRDDDGNTALHWAAPRDYTEITELLIRKGADVNAKNKKGETPLHIVAATGRSEERRVGKECRSRWSP